MKQISRKDIVINHNIMMKSPRKLDFVGTDKYDNKMFIAVEDLIKCIDDTYKDLDMGKTIPIFIQRLKEKLNSQSNDTETFCNNQGNKVI